MSTIRTPLLARDAELFVPFVAAGLLGAAEIHGADALVRDVSSEPAVRLGAMLALWAPLNGHVCFDLAQRSALVESALASAESSDDEADRVVLPWPETDAWVGALVPSPLVRVVDTHDPQPVLDGSPLVLFGTRLYVQRLWVDECVVVAALRARAAAAPSRALHVSARALLDHLLPPQIDGRPNLQSVAAVTATERCLAVITGGPGSGKTHTIARIVAALLADADARGESLRVAVAAPTGKAAQRIGETIAAAAGGGLADVPAAVLERLGDVPSLTLHRLLGPLPAVRTRFRSDTDHPLPHDVVIVDETSMVPLPMMARLLEALPADARLVLVGDPDQLSSVEAGAILGDIVGAAAVPGSTVAACSVRLDRAHRQSKHSAIGPLADAIREARADDVVALLRSSEDLTFLEQSESQSQPDGGDVRTLVAAHLADCRRAALEGDAGAALAAASTTRLLCAHRRGPFGADSWNELVASWMFGGQRPPRNYAGRMLLATRNDLRNRLSNGDSGVVVAAGDRLRAAFRVGGEIRTFAPAQLESVETAFATTVHKSQGSEYDTVVVVLPPAGSPLARRELLYTAVTRATRRVVVVGSVGSLVASVTTRTPRASGLEVGLAR